MKTFNIQYIDELEEANYFGSESDADQQSIRDRWTLEMAKLGWELDTVIVSGRWDEEAIDRYDEWDKAADIAMVAACEAVFK